MPKVVHVLLLVLAVFSFHYLVQLCIYVRTHFTCTPTWWSSHATCTGDVFFPVLYSAFTDVSINTFIRTLKYALCGVVEVLFDCFIGHSNSECPCPELGGGALLIGTHLR